MERAKNIVPLFGSSELIEAARSTISFAQDGLKALETSFGDPGFQSSFQRAIALIIRAEGRIILTGMGKSGLIARKTVGTLTSTGTPALFLHPAEAGHGDMGMIAKGDVILMFSNSGETAELAPIIRHAKRFGIPMVAVTTRIGSAAARAADIALKLPPVRESCPIDMAPTTSTTVQAVFGDALAMALMRLRGFSRDDFHIFHPNGQLGAQLLTVGDLMARGDEVPTVTGQATLLDATVEMTRARLGGTAVVDDTGRLIGAFTDGDLRRALTANRPMTTEVGALMTLNPAWIGPQDLASDALRRMHDRSILMLFVCDRGKVVGAVHMHDVLRAGVA